MDGVAVALAISSLFGIPTAWVLLRVWILGSHDALEEYARYFELKHGISFKSMLCVGIPALAVTIACLVVFLSRQS